MFKIGKLYDTDNEKLEVSRMEITEYKFENGVKKGETWETLCFDIDGAVDNNSYGFTFALNCKDEKLLELPMDEVINIKDYIMSGETFFSINGKAEIDPSAEFYVMRYTKSSFVFNVKIQTDYGKELYGGNIEFEINLDDPITKKNPKEVVGWTN